MSLKTLKAADLWRKCGWITWGGFSGEDNRIQAGMDGSDMRFTGCGGKLSRKNSGNLEGIVGLERIRPHRFSLKAIRRVRRGQNSKATGHIGHLVQPPYSRESGKQRTEVGHER